MKIKWTKLAVVAAAVGALTLSTTAYANLSAVGSISFGGAYTVPNANLTTPEVATINSAVVTSSGGVLSGATMWTTAGGLSPLGFASSIGINGAGPSMVNAVLWTVTAGGINWQFTVNSEAVDGTSTSSNAGLKGSGTLKDMSNTLYADTSGIWQIGFGQAGAFSWQSSASTTPDGGTTAMLLGIALSGAALLKKKLTA